MRPIEGAISRLRRFLPLAPRPVAEAEPVQAAFTFSIATEADVPVPVGANGAVVVQLIFDVRLGAPGTCD